MSNHDYDIAIVGGGLVGASLTLALRGYPGRVALIDRPVAAPPHGAPLDLRSTALNEGSRRFLHRLGLWQALAAQASPIERIHVSDRGHFGAVRLHAADYNLRALGYVVENRHLQDAFAGALAHGPALHCRPERVLGIDLPAAPAQPVSLHLESGTRLRTRLLVLAAGSASGLLSGLPVRLDTQSYGQVALVTNVIARRPRPGVAFERFTRDGPVAMLPLGEDRYAVVMTVAEAARDELLALPDAGFLARLQALFGWRLGALTAAGQRAAFPLALVRAEASGLARTLLIGNAARTLHPVAGQGFNLALRDVAELAALLSGDGAHAGDPGAAGLLQTFHRRRHADRLGAVLITDLLARTFASDFPPLVAARGAALVGLELLAPLRHRFARRSMGLGANSPLRGLPVP